MKQVVLDTSVASMIVDERPSAAFYRPHIESGISILPFQTVAEMRLGASLAQWGEPRLARLEQFFTDALIQEQDALLIICWVKIMRDARLAGRRLDCRNGFTIECSLVDA